MRRCVPLRQQAGGQQKLHGGLEDRQRSQGCDQAKHGLKTYGNGSLCHERAGRPLCLPLLLNGLVGAGFLAEPGLEQIFRQGSQGFRVILGINIPLEALNLKRLRHGELDRGHRWIAMGQAEAMAFQAQERHVDYLIGVLSAAQDDDRL